MKRVRCFDFGRLVLTQFAISFQDHHYLLPNFNRSISIVILQMFWDLNLS